MKNKREGKHLPEINRIPLSFWMVKERSMDQRSPVRRFGRSQGQRASSRKLDQEGPCVN